MEGTLEYHRTVLALHAQVVQPLRQVPAQQAEIIELAQSALKAATWVRTSEEYARKAHVTYNRWPCPLFCFANIWPFCDCTPSHA